MKKANITKAFLAITFLVALFMTGLFLGRDQTPVDGFTIRTQYDETTPRGDTIEEPQVEEMVMASVYPEEMEEEQGAEEEDTEEVFDQIFPININSATAEELMALPGIGPVIAARIVAHREVYGEFQMIEEITDVPGIGVARFSAMAELITVY